MKPPYSWLRCAAQALAGHAARVLPRARADWARAMRRETDQVANDRAALRWALGCVFASYLERIDVMNARRHGISRWVLGLEMLMCFWWLTWMFGALLSRGAYGFTGPLPLDAWYVATLLGTVAGPIGLVVAFKSIVLDRPALGRATLVALCVPAVWTVIAITGQFASSAFLAEAFGAWVLFALLPAIGVSHLIYLGRPQRSSLVAA